MPLGARDIMMVVRARDLASRTLRNIGTNMGVMGTKAGQLQTSLFNIGSALTTVGLGMAAAGAAGVTWFDNSIDAAIKYNNEAAKTLTQTDGLGAKLEDIKDIARDVAREIPAPFEQMQTSLYDVFSSMDVNLDQSRMLLREFSRAAVAGQVDLQDATRGTIGILNAYGMEAEEVHRVNDIMFQLVRKGVGTYGEFNSTIGLAVPAAVRAGQSVETLAGMMAFMTRNGVSASRSASSAMRALENLSDPRIVKRMEDMGITVRDAAGNFVPMSDVVEQLGKKLEGLPKPEKAAVLQELLKGAGNSAQARRFWNLAIENYDEFQQRVDEMIGSAGAMEDAYKIMFEDPQVQLQLLKNNYEVLRTEVGDKLLPIKVKLAQAALKVIDAWNRLDERTQGLIIKIAAFGSAFALVAGIAVTVVGGMLALIAVIMSMGATFGGAVAIIGGFLGALALIPVAAYLIITHWETLVGWAKKLWGWFKSLSDWVKPLVAGLAAFAVAGWPIVGVITAIVTAGYLLYKNWDKIWPYIVDGWGAVQRAASSVWQTMQKVWDWISKVAVGVWHDLNGAWQATVDAFKAGWKWFDDNFGKGFRKIFGAIGKEVPAVLKEVGQTVVSVFNTMMKPISAFGGIFRDLFAGLTADIQKVAVHIQLMWAYAQPALSMMKDSVVLAFNIIKEIILFVMDLARERVQFILGVIAAAWDSFGGILIDLVKRTWNFVSTFISNIVKIISNLIQAFLNIIQGDWGEAWNNIKAVFKAAWDNIWAALQFVFGNMKIFFTQLPGKILGFIGNVGSLLYGTGKSIIQSLLNGLNNIWNNIAGWFRGVANKIISYIPNPGRILLDIGKKIIEGLWNGMKQVWEGAKNWVGGLGGAIVDLKGPPAKDAILLTNNGKLIMKGLQKGLMQEWTNVEKLLGSMTDSVSPSFTVNGAMSGNVPVNPISGSGLTVMGDLVVREEKVVDDMDWFARTRMSGV